MSFAYHASVWRFVLVCWLRADLDHKAAASVSAEIKRPACPKTSCKTPQDLYSHFLLFISIHSDFLVRGTSESLSSRFDPIKTVFFQFCLLTKTAQPTKSLKLLFYPSSGLVSDIGPPSTKVPILLFERSRFSWLWFPTEKSIADKHLWNKYGRYSHEWA